MKRLKIFLDEFWCYEDLDTHEANVLDWEGDFNEILCKIKDPEKGFIMLFSKCFINGWSFRFFLETNDGWYSSVDLSNENKPNTLLSFFKENPVNFWIGIEQN